MWMSWKCALTVCPTVGQKGESPVIRLAFAQRIGGSLAPLHAGNDSFVGPHTDIMGPDMGTNEQVMAWFMDTYSCWIRLRGE